MLSPFGATVPCCIGACTDQGKQKYYSVDAKHGFCGETCIHPFAYPLFKAFEPNLTAAVGTDSPCKDRLTPTGTHYTVYNGTVTHGISPLTVTLDLYAPGPKLWAPGLFKPPQKKKTTWRDLRAHGYRYTFGEYCAEYGKSYATPSDAAEHERVFVAALAAIRKHNEASPAPSWRMGLSEHSDKTAAEWRALKGLNRAARFAAAAAATLGEAAPPATPAGFTLPASVDWRERGVVTPVKNQAGCGSCWAFSATEAIESAVALAGGPLLELAPQQLVSCAPDPQECGGTGGCAGSTQPLGFKYVVEAGGIELGKDYPYTGTDGTCTASKSKFAAGIKAWVNLPANNYSALMQAVATIGPVAISVAASWGGYEEGVFSGRCGEMVDHAVLLVGYGATAEGEKYWLVRNSWGSSWGEGGYIKIKRWGEGNEPCGTDNSPRDGFGCNSGPDSVQVCGLCGILSSSSYPTGGFVSEVEA